MEVPDLAEFISDYYEMTSTIRRVRFPPTADGSTGRTQALAGPYSAIPLMRIRGGQGKEILTRTTLSVVAISTN